jgi:hypothetical protein
MLRNYLLACGGLVLAVYLWFVFALCGRKKRIIKEDEVPLRTITSGAPHIS